MKSVVPLDSGCHRHTTHRLLINARKLIKVCVNRICCISPSVAVLLSFEQSFQVTVRPMLRDGCPVCLSVCAVCLSCSSVTLVWPNGWLDQDATWCGGRPRPRRHCVRWGPNSPPRKGARQPPTFGPMSIAAKQSPISATAELLFGLPVSSSEYSMQVVWRGPTKEKV